MGVGKKRLILLCVVVLVVVMVRFPSVDAASVDEWLLVESFDATTDDGWTEVGSTPYLDYQDQPTNYIYCTSGGGGGKDHGNYDFFATSATTVTDVNITIYHNTAEITRVTIYNSTNSDTISFGNSGGGWAYETITQTSEAEELEIFWPSKAELDAAYVVINAKSQGAAGQVSVDEIKIGVTGSSAGGTAYTAYPSGSLALGGTTSLAAAFSITLVEAFSLTGGVALAAAFVVTLIQGFTLVGTTSLAAAYSKRIVEGFALAGTTSIFVIIQLLIVEGFSLTGGVALAASYVVLLAQGFALGGTTALAVAFVVTLVEGFSLAGTISALKVLIVNLQESFTVGGITTLIATSLIGSIFYQLFISPNLWGYLGPIALVIGGYFAMKKDRSLGVIWFVVECLVMAQYFALLDATPDYWWHIIIILLGSLFTIGFPLWSRRR